MPVRRNGKFRIMETNTVFLYIVLGYLLLINLITYIVYALDKRKAKKGQWRTSEATLITLAFVGGSVGALLAMRLCRHKTKHVKFLICVPLALVLQLALAFWLLFGGK